MARPKGMKHTPESKAKMIAAWDNREEVSQETRQKMSEAKLGRTRPPFTEEHKAKIAASKKAHHEAKKAKESK